MELLRDLPPRERAIVVLRYGQVDGRPRTGDLVYRPFPWHASPCVPLTAVFLGVGARRARRHTLRIL